MSSVLTVKKIKELCDLYKLRPSKNFGQNYLISSVPIKKMLDAAEVSKNDTVIEIGPGFGILTFALAQKAKRVIAYEIEKKLMPYWDDKLAEYANVEMVWGDALTQIKNQKSKIKNEYKVIANLPYQITSHVLRVLLESDNKPESITVMVQKEVAERICAKPGGMSLLAVSVRYFGEPTIVARVSKGNFWPMPQVDSAAVHIKTRKQENKKTVPDDTFFRLLRAGFAHPRKQLWRNLSAGLNLPSDKVKEALKNTVSNEKVRSEELSVQQWIVLTQILH